MLEPHRALVPDRLGLASGLGDDPVGLASSLVQDLLGFLLRHRRNRLGLQPGFELRCPFPGLDLDAFRLTSGPLQDAVLRIEDGDHRVVDRLPLSVSRLLRLVLGVLQPILGVLCPGLQIPEVLFELAQELPHLALVVALSRGRELLAIDRSRKLGGAFPHAGSIGRRRARLD